MVLSKLGKHRKSLPKSWNALKHLLPKNAEIEDAFLPFISPNVQRLYVHNSSNQQYIIKISCNIGFATQDFRPYPGTAVSSSSSR